MSSNNGLPFKLVTNDNTNGAMDLTGLATQLGINAAIAVGVILAFNILRPNHSLVYAPKMKYAEEGKRPPKVGKGLFDWVKPVAQVKDDVLIRNIGWDAVMFIRCLRMFRRIFYSLSIVGCLILIPINIAATSQTGDQWPPTSANILNVLSITAINTYGNSYDKTGELRWFWAHSAGTYIMSGILYFIIWRSYAEYIQMRQQYFESTDYQATVQSKSLLVMNLPAGLQSDEKLRKWMQQICTKYPIQQASVGRKSGMLNETMEKHEAAVRELENTLASYLKDGKVSNNRPMKTIGGKLGCGGRKVDAIDYLSHQVQTYEEQIEHIRSNIQGIKPENYGWVSFSRVSWAHAAAKQLRNGVPSKFKTGALNSPIIRLAPAPNDVVWSNMAMSQAVRRSKKIFWNVVYYLLLILWFVPTSILSVSSNVKSVINLFPNSKAFTNANPFFISLVEAWFAPLVMALFFLILPHILRAISRRQGYITKTSLDRQVLGKLYLFFIINNLLVFTIASTILNLYTKISASVNSGDTINVISLMRQNLNLLARSLANVSTYWTNYVTLRSLGILMDLAQIFSLLYVGFRKWFFNPSPRQLREFTRPPNFDYSLSYNLLLFFFTVGLVYSVIAPLILPFTLFYFFISTVVFRYLLMYIFTTKTETGGQIFRVIINRVLASTVLFQLIMILILYFKSATIQTYTICPLPVITIIYKIVLSKRFDPYVYYYKVPASEEHAIPSVDGPGATISRRNRIGIRFGNPAFFAELPTPMVHERAQHLLPQVFAGKMRGIQESFTSKVTRKKSVKHMSIINRGDAHDLRFQAIPENELDIDDRAEGLDGVYKYNEYDMTPYPMSTPMMSANTPAMRYQQPQTYQPSRRPSDHDDPYSANRPLMAPEFNEYHSPTMHDSDSSYFGHEAHQYDNTHHHESYEMGNVNDPYYSHHSQSAGRNGYYPPRV
ncbi:hypothetical protein BC943DRAFT_296004 [Umbelopsis sp. AD052]|nr:hypothetical protein BC943DRAFT_296004 [Umbelopsis sp. AD052]